jgi:hypothetical protein
MEDFYDEGHELNKLIDKNSSPKPVIEKNFKKFTILEKVNSLVASANEGTGSSRKTLIGQAHEVAISSLKKNFLVLDSSIRDFRVIRDVEAFIHANKTGTLRDASVSYSGLLYYGNPASTSEDIKDASPEVLADARAEWVSQDPRISEEYRPLVASAFNASKDSAEREFAVARMSSLGASEVPVDIVLLAIEYES